MPGFTASARSHGSVRKGAVPTSTSESTTAITAAVSATKERASSLPNIKEKLQDNPNGVLCIALYRTREQRKRIRQEEPTTSSEGRIWWPALRFPSIEAFQRATESNLLGNERNRKSLRWSTDRKKRKHRKRLVQKVMKEALGDSPIEALCYLGRPLEEYVTADAAVKTGVEVQESHIGVSLLTNQANWSLFPSLFLSAGDEDHEASPGFTHNAEALELFRDYYAGLDEFFEINNELCEDSDSSDDDSHKEDHRTLFAPRAQTIWNDYHNNDVVRRQRDEDDDDEEEEEDNDDDESSSHAPRHAPPHDDASVAALSAAAVSYTEASLTSASRGCASTAVAATFPPPLADEVLREEDDFETIWEKHQMEGWDNYVQEELTDGSETMVYEAPNGFRFESHEAFCEYLTETYGFCGSKPPARESPPRKPTKMGRGRSVASRKNVNRKKVERRTNDGCLLPKSDPVLLDDGTYKRPKGSPPKGLKWDKFRGLWTPSDRRAKTKPPKEKPTTTTTTTTTEWQRSPPRARSRSRSLSPVTGEIQFRELWRYLYHTLDWTYDYSTRIDEQMYGLSTTALWFRKGFNMKNRGELNKDFFVKEDDVLKYCLEHGIRPPVQEAVSTPTDSAAGDEEGDKYEEEDEVDEEIAESSDCEEEAEDDEETAESSELGSDPGYATPDDQSTVPQDPGKPRLASPPGTGSSRTSGGSFYSYDNDPNRYVFGSLWERLKDKGWSWCRPKNKFDDYWYVRPASIRPESEWIRGTDYFVTEDEVIDFIRSRDDLSKKEREERWKERAWKRHQEALRQRDAEEPDEIKPKKRQGTQKKETNKSRSKGKKQKAATSTEEPSNKGSKKQKAAASKEEPTNKGSKKQKAAASKDESSNEGNKTQKAAGAKGKTNKDLKLESMCKDENLRVSENTAPWAKDMPKYDHNLCVTATGLEWSGYGYLLSRGTSNGHPVKVSNVRDVALHYALNPETVVWASGGTRPATKDERSFERLVRYALVPGRQSEWSGIRMIDQSETSFLLRKIGYQTTGRITQLKQKWNPPAAFVGMGLLRKEYGSLESLCEALRCMDGDLQTPPGSRSRKKHLSPTQLMALRLRLAVGFGGPEMDGDVEETSDSNSVARKEAKNAKNCDDVEERSESDSLAKKKAKNAENCDYVEERSESDSVVRKKTNNSIARNKANKVQNKANGEITPEQKIREFEDNKERQLAMSPSKIKVGEFRKNPEDNTAPWAVNPPLAPSWSKIYNKMGIIYSMGYYYLPGESSKQYTARFTSVEDTRIHICREGNYGQYLNKLNEEEQKLVRRHFNYCYVPGTHYDWRKLRKLNRKEIVLFLNLLGFEKSPEQPQVWRIPEGVPILERKSYPSFSELCRALVRLPDLEDRTNGMVNRRRSRKRDDDTVLSEYQMMALRLCLAESLYINDEKIVAKLDKRIREVDRDGNSMGKSNKRKGKVEEDEIIVGKTDKRKEKENGCDGDDMLLVEISETMIYEFIPDKRDHKGAWKALQNLGCTYASTYSVPGLTTRVDGQDNLVNLILQHSVTVLDWEHCTLGSADIGDLVMYLKTHHGRSSNFSLLQEARKLVTRGTIENCLKKIGILSERGKYFIESDEYDESDIVNIIRRSEDLCQLCHKESSTKMKRRRSHEDRALTDKETLILRLWAAFVDIPLTNMPERSMIGRAHKSDNRKRKQIEQAEVDRYPKISTKEQRGNECIPEATFPQAPANDNTVTSSTNQLKQQPLQQETTTEVPEDGSKANSSNQMKERDEEAPANENATTSSDMNPSVDSFEHPSQHNATAPDVLSEANSSDPPRQMDLEALAPTDGDVNALVDHSPQQQASTKVFKVVPQDDPTNPSSNMDLDAETTRKDRVVNPPPPASPTMGGASVTDSTEPGGLLTEAPIPMDSEGTGSGNNDRRQDEKPPGALPSPIEAPVPMDVQQDTDTGTLATKDAEEASETKQLSPERAATATDLPPESAAESAFKLAKHLLQTHQHDGRGYETTEPFASPRKKSRKTYSKEQRRKKEYVKGLLSPARQATDLATPKQHNGTQAFPRGPSHDGAYGGGGGKRSRTASSHGEAFGDSLALLTQPACEENDNDTIAAMEHAAQLEIPSPAWTQSPEEPMSRKPRASQCYGSGSRHPSDRDVGFLTQVDGEMDFMTQPDDDDRGWLDQPINQSSTKKTLFDSNDFSSLN